MQRFFRSSLHTLRIAQVPAKFIRVPDDIRNSAQQLLPTQIKVVGWDFGGTIFPYCHEPLLAFEEAFKKHNIDISKEEISESLGMGKRAQISHIYVKRYGVFPEDRLITAIYDYFMKILLELLAEAKIVPEAKEAYHELKAKKIKMLGLTAYSKSEVEVLKPELLRNKMPFDKIITSDDVIHSRPHPALVERAKDYFNIVDPREFLIAGDTPKDIESGLKALMWTVGIPKYGAPLKIYSLKQARDMLLEELEKRWNKAGQILAESGAHYIAFSLKQIPALVDEINLRLQHGHLPYQANESIEMSVKKLTMA